MRINEAIQKYRDAGNASEDTGTKISKMQYWAGRIAAEATRSEPVTHDAAIEMLHDQDTTLAQRDGKLFVTATIELADMGVLNMVRAVLEVKHATGA